MIKKPCWSEMLQHGFFVDLSHLPDGHTITFIAPFSPA
jgi:hypothetical protein